MKDRASFLVRRYAPLLGRTSGPRVVTIAYFARSSDEAINAARHTPGPTWIERRGAVAYRTGFANDRDPKRPRPKNRKSSTN